MGAKLRGRIDERDGGETFAERPGDEREVDRAELRLGRADLEHTEVDQLPPDRFAGFRGDDAVLAGPSSDQLADALGEHLLFVCQLELHVTPGEGRGSGRR